MEGQSGHDERAEGTEPMGLGEGSECLDDGRLFHDSIIFEYMASLLLPPVARNGPPLCAAKVGFGYC